MTAIKPIFVSTQDLAKAMGRTPRTIQRMIVAGQIPKHCYTQAGRGPRQFLRIALEFYRVHGRWPKSRAEQTAWGRKLVQRCASVAKY